MRFLLVCLFGRPHLRGKKSSTKTKKPNEKRQIQIKHEIVLRRETTASTAATATAVGDILIQSRWSHRTKWRKERIKSEIKCDILCIFRLIFFDCFYYPVSSGLLSSIVSTTIWFEFDANAHNTERANDWKWYSCVRAVRTVVSDKQKSIEQLTICD